MRTVKDPRAQRAHHIDIHVGARVRTRRTALKISQQELAGHLNLTFQQVQKYERGANRISASKLYGIAKVFKVKVETFFEGLPDTEGDGSVTNEIAAFNQQAVEIAQAVPSMLKVGLLNRKGQQAIGDLIESVVEQAAAG